MNFTLFSRRPIQERAHEQDDGADDWLGGEAWVAPQRLALDPVESIRRTGVGDPAMDWIPL